MLLKELGTYSMRKNEYVHSFVPFGFGMEFSNSVEGQVYKVNVSNPAKPEVTIQADGLRTLAVSK